MSDPLGMSIGTTNLVAVGVGHQPLLRRAAITRSGMVLSGFVERVGDPVPLVAADGTAYPAPRLVVEALDELAAQAVATPPAEVAIAVPSYWNPAATGALAEALGASRLVSTTGSAPRLIPDAVAALTALNANPGFDRSGVLAVLDFGGGGTSITLADGASAFAVIGETERYPEFAGDQVDQSLLGYVLDRAGGDQAADPAQTAAVGSLARLREECRAAKERLSFETATTLAVDLPDLRTDMRLTRAELEELIARPLAGVGDVLENVLAGNGVSWANLSAVVLVGGGASIPLITQQLSERSRVTVVKTPQPALDAAVGAAMIAAYGRAAETATWVAPAAPPVVPVDEAASSTMRALAWSQDDVDDVVPYSGDDPYPPPDSRAAPEPYQAPNPYQSLRSDAAVPPADDDVKPWQRVPLPVAGLLAVVALVVVGGLAIALTSFDSPEEPRPRPGTDPLSSAIAPPEPPGPAETVTMTGAPPPPVQPTPPEPAPPPVVTTTTTTQPTTNQVFRSTWLPRRTDQAPRRQSVWGQARAEPKPRHP
ncbi:MAG: Hsp70 family protein, partial [Actinomycetota bacterium]|nr:Hsp70 family protein [Actinomycetota bacterium]